MQRPELSFGKVKPSMPETSSRRFLLGAAIAALFLFSSGTALALIAQERYWLVLGITLQSLGAAVLFPIVVSYVYDRLREAWFGDEVWRIFSELTEAGIVRIYRDREPSDRADDAHKRLLREFYSFKVGEVLMLGTTLRVFFNPLGPYYKCISDMLGASEGRVTLRALIEHEDSPSAKDREAIEERGLLPGEISQAHRDRDSSIASVRAINREVGDWARLAKYTPAPYCTVVIFPHVAYYSPNLLSETVPVRMPMIVFRSGSHAYDVLRESFEYLWSKDDTSLITKAAGASSPLPDTQSGFGD